MNLQTQLKNLTLEILNKIIKESNFESDSEIKINDFFIGETKIPDNLNLEKKFYHFSSNAALVNAKNFKTNPLNLANKMKTYLEESNLIKEVLVTSPGFLNFIFNDQVLIDIVNLINQQGTNYLKDSAEHKLKINDEFVSVNPTGFLHFGHARGAIYADTLNNFLIHAGHDLIREYYVNDAGNQIDIVSQSTYLRYLELFGKEITLPEESYKGEDIIEFAKVIKDKYHDKFLNQKDDFYTDPEFKNLVTEIALNEIKKDMHLFNIKHDLFFSEKTLYGKPIEDAMAKIKKHTYEKDGALFLKTTAFGDDKDRVLIKKDGTFTYFLPDIAYHNKKFQNVDKLIAYWGADHGGYVKRVKIAIDILGYDSSNYDIEIIQLVRLIKDGAEFKMSKRAGTGLFLREMLNYSTVDALRWYMIARDLNTKMDFDLNKANEASQDNPVYSVQYAYVRTVSLLEKATLKNVTSSQLTNDKERQLIMFLNEFKNIFDLIVRTYKVNLIIPYLIDLKNAFNAFYAEEKIIDSDNQISKLALVKATQTILKLSFGLIGISSPNKMQK
ncbi:arginine--tRNA ligase [Mycoplasmopsis agassizii]|uniref:arginine--tRNA ligase n=1 Tax=Mycoplasmopsis agassizii TaxID=33922 RepID=UPI00352754C4